jgi:hypothetical protein
MVGMYVVVVPDTVAEDETENELDDTNPLHQAKPYFHCNSYHLVLCYFLDPI